MTVLKAPRGTLVAGGWSLRLLRSLEWKRFEMLCEGALAAAGYEVWTTILENEGLLDLVISSPNPADGGLRTAVRCRSFDGTVIGADVVGQMVDTVSSKGYAKGIIIAAGVFSPEAEAVAQEEEEKIVLLEGSEFLSRLVSLSRNSRDSLYDSITEGDYSTPTCPTCGKSMIRGVAQDGFGDDETWRCFDSEFEDCRRSFPVVNLDIPYPPVVEEPPVKKGWIFSVRSASGKEESFTVGDLMSRCLRRAAS